MVQSYSREIYFPLIFDVREINFPTTDIKKESCCCKHRTIYQKWGVTTGGNQRWRGDSNRGIDPKKWTTTCNEQLPGYAFKCCFRATKGLLQNPFGFHSATVHTVSILNNLLKKFVINQLHYPF